jgi:hypothetical protein
VKLTGEVGQGDSQISSSHSAARRFTNLQLLHDVVIMIIQFLLHSSYVD